MNKFFITTPIYYINDIPHIGHTCTTVAADVVARLHRAKGEEVFFLTGTDEHGQKVAETAQKEGLEVKAYCDKISPRFEEAWKKLDISFDFFIRTTDPRHEKVVAEVLQKIYDKGDVYKAKYEGLYCVGCEKFLTESELVDNHCGLHPPEKTVFKSEENWFFKLSKYVPEIIKLIENDKTNYIYPIGKKLEILAKLKSGVKDVSISRENVEWGIPTPWDKSQTVYVWFDALINYYSATQFVEGKKDFWPADLHLLGKEILWFHTVIWQAMLLSAEISLPKKTYTHSFYMIDGQKMSKSLGNVISPQQLVDLFGVEESKYLIVRSFPSENDSDVGINRFKEKYNADLANNLGNLVSRVAKLAEGQKTEEEKIEFDNEFEELINNLKLDEAFELVFNKYVDASNLKLNQTSPWKLEKENPERIAVLNECIKNIRKAAFHLQILMPKVAEKIENCFKNEVKPLSESLFPRIK
ncbi:MAG: class I tRNA ligase family protein [Candidatus Shapirobacteria bacterium]|nr:class I tRNA ligase family protein [Candidatus Shapirobacteria bacterium]MDD4410791.1 class I tRNA ligase family protein [Candidatus Shapirobacteria bacterium]